MDPIKLKEILESHKLWIESRGNKGRKADLTGAILPKSNLRGANLAEADLTGANLSGANLDGANLTDANLSYANLSYANLMDAVLSSANLTRAGLSGANLTGAKVSIELRDINWFSYLKINKHHLPWLILNPKFRTYQSTLTIK